MASESVKLSLYLAFHSWMQRFSEEKLMPIFVTGRESAAFVAHQLIHQSCLVYITLTGVAQFLKAEDKKKTILGQKQQNYLPYSGNMNTFAR